MKNSIPSSPSPQSISPETLPRVAAWCIPLLQPFSRHPEEEPLTGKGLTRLDAFETEMESLVDLITDVLSDLYTDLSDGGCGEVGTLDGIVTAWIAHNFPWIPTALIFEGMTRAGFPDTARNRITGERYSYEEAHRRSCEEFREMVSKYTVHYLKTMPYKDYLQTEHWHNIRDLARENAGNRCQLCNSDKSIHVHHRTYDRRGEEMPDDVIVLCASCHQHFHNKLKVVR